MAVVVTLITQRMIEPRLGQYKRAVATAKRAQQRKDEEIDPPPKGAG